MILNRVDIKNEQLYFYRDKDTLSIDTVPIDHRFRDITIHKINGSSLSMIVFVLDGGNRQFIIESNLQTNILACIGTILDGLIRKNDDDIADIKKTNTHYRHIMKNLGLHGYG